MKKILYYIKLKMSYIFILDKNIRDYKKSTADLNWKMAKENNFQFVDKFGNDDLSDL